MGSFACDVARPAPSPTAPVFYNSCALTASIAGFATLFSPQQTADLLARYCVGREPPRPGSARRRRPDSISKTAAASSVQGAPWSDAHGHSVGGIGGGSGDGPVAALTLATADERLVATPPGAVVVIAQSLSYALGVVLALCEAGGACPESEQGPGGTSSSPSSSTMVRVLCSPVWWDPADDEPAERHLAARFPTVRLVKQEVDCQSLVGVGADTADLVCVVASRPEEDAPAVLTPGGLGESIGRGQGSDAWALGVAVDVLGLVPESTRVVVRFDDSTSAEQHQVVSAHVRRRTDAAAAGGAGREKNTAVGNGGGGGGEGKQGDGAGDGEGDGGGEEEGAQLGVGVGAGVEGTHPAAAAAVAAFGAPHSDASPREIASRSLGRAPLPRKWSAGMLMEDSLNLGDASEPGEAGGEVYFDDTRGVVHKGFDDYFATQSGYVSGDVVIGNAAELLLLQVCIRGGGWPVTTAGVGRCSHTQRMIRDFRFTVFELSPHRHSRRS